MLFAAGFGTRMRALTKTRPKPLVEVCGKALIDHAMDQVRTYGAKTIVVNLHYRPDQIKSHLAGQEVLFSEEVPDILETGGGLRAALPLLGPDPVFTMNTDAVWKGPNPLDLLAQAWTPDTMDALLLCIPKDKAIGHRGNGDFVNTSGSLADRGPGLVYSGLQILKTDLLADVSDTKFSLNVIWDDMLSGQRLHMVPYPGAWCDVGQPESIAQAEALLECPDV